MITDTLKQEIVNLFKTTTSDFEVVVENGIVIYCKAKVKHLLFLITFLVKNENAPDSFKLSLKGNHAELEYNGKTEHFTL